MSIVRLTMYQKQIGKDSGGPLLKITPQMKSDFLLLPEYFGSDSSMHALEDLKQKNEFLLEEIQKESENYKGVIIAAGFFLEEKGKNYTGAVLVSDGAVIDWYRKRKLTNEESKHCVSGGDCGIYILAGQRFSILLGDEVFDDELLKEIASMGISWVMNPAGGSEKNSESSYAKLSESCSRHGLYIVRCMPAGMQFGTKVFGRSVIVTPAGVNWKLSEQEAEKEIIKTVNINFR